MPPNLTFDQLSDHQKKVEEKNDNHFVAFVEHEGALFELDGTKSFPVNHGATTRETFLADACTQAKKFMERDPEETAFGMIVLAKKQA